MTIEPRTSDLNYSLRRYFIDRYQAQVVATWPAGTQVLDLGGDRIDKRGQFDIGRYPVHTINANASTHKRPDVQANAVALPFRDEAFDAVICAELLEHVYDPRRVLQEVWRVLRPGGRLLITVPFMVHMHGDPDDYGRYTDSFWNRLLTETGFDQIAIERQGQLWAVVLDALRAWVIEMRRRRPGRRPVLGLAGSIVAWGRGRAIVSETAASADASSLLSQFTTGFGISGRKRSESRAKVADEASLNSGLVPGA